MSNLDFYDLKRLFHLREILEALDPREPPRALFFDPPPNLSLQRAGILSGSFNPPTLAHVELGLRARKSFRLDAVLFMISRVTVDKEEAGGLSLEDRLLILSSLAGDLGWACVAVVNRGLYYEQACALRSLLGNRPRLYFIMGTDKVVQILDPRYYDDREKALLTLFTEAQLIAAPREGLGSPQLEELLDRNENLNFNDRVYFLPMPEQLKGTSSSAVRVAIEKGESVQGQLPETVEKFITETGAYRRPYDLRRLLLDRLYAIREWAQENVDFPRLLAIAAEGTERGEKLRSLLRFPLTSEDQLKDFIQHALR